MVSFPGRTLWWKSLPAKSRLGWRITSSRISAVQLITTVRASLLVTLTIGENHESNGNRHPETSYIGTKTKVFADGSPSDVATLSRWQDGAVLVARQRGGRDLPDERGVG
jgi:hypothetical protein